MKKFLFFLLTAAALFAQNRSVTFRVVAPSIMQGERVFIAGNQTRLGDWSPGGVALEEIAPKIFEVKVSFSAGTKLEYKFTKGSWETEAMYKKGVIPQNFELQVEKDTVVEYNISLWKDKDLSRPGAGQITGKAEYHRNLDYPGIKKRDVIVWLPPGYDSSSARYPVLYMHDGQNVFDPATSTLGFDWRADETADSLIRNNIIEPVIIVAINNTSDRRSEYSANDTGRAYMNFIVHRLKPMIDSVYRTKPERANTATAGSSMGGLIAFMLAWEHGDVISKAACFSPAFLYKSYDYIQLVRNEKGIKKDITVYIDNGGKGLEQILQPGVEQMKDELIRKGYREGEDLMYMIFPDDEHSEPAWSRRLHFPMKMFFGNNAVKR